MNSGQRKTPIGSLAYLWRRPLWLAAWTLTAVMAVTLVAPIAFNSMADGVAKLDGGSDMKEIQLECATLEGEIDSLIHVLRREAPKAPMTGDPQQEVTRLLTEAGLTLMSFSREATPPRAQNPVNRWRLSAAGNAADWGAYLAKFESCPGSGRIESAVWTTQSWTDREPHGNVVLAFPESNEK